ncbi:VUT family protein [bacterium]|nr:VUT family protein [bacterium]
MLVSLRVASKYSFVALIVAYVSVVAVSNLLVDKFIDLGPFGLLSAGTITFGITFTIRDLAHQASARAGLGRRPVFLMIGIAALVNVVVAMATNTPARFLVASFLAILISEGIDTEIYHRLRTRSWLVRVLSSNAVSVPLDSSIFTIVAFFGVEGYDVITMLQIVQADLIFKFLVGTILAFIKTAWNRRNDRASLTA